MSAKQLSDVEFLNSVVKMGFLNSHNGCIPENNLQYTFGYQSYY